MLVKFLAGLYFYSPYMTLYFLDRGLNYIQINSVWGIIVLTMFLTEIPTGILADRIGRRKAVQAAIFLQFVGEFLFLFITQYWLLVIDAVIAGLGFAFGSGALEALVYDQLSAENRPDQMKKVMGRLNGATYLGFVISFGLSGFLVQRATQTNIRNAILYTTIAVGLAFLLTLTLKTEKTPGDLSANPQPLIVVKEGFRLLQRNKTLRRLVLLSILTIGFWDYLANLYQPYFQKIGVPDAFFGPTMALASIAAFLAVNKVQLLEQKIGAQWGLLVATIAPGIIYLVLFINPFPWIGVLAIIFFRGLNALKNPLFAAYHNRQIASHHRATMLSFISMIAGGYTAVMGLIIGAIAEYSLTSAFLFAGLLVTTAAILLRVDRTTLTS